MQTREGQNAKRQQEEKEYKMLQLEEIKSVIPQEREKLLEIGEYL